MISKENEEESKMAVNDEMSDLSGDERFNKMRELDIINVSRQQIHELLTML